MTAAAGVTGLTARVDWRGLKGGLTPAAAGRTRPSKGLTLGRPRRLLAVKGTIAATGAATAVSPSKDV